MPNPTAVLATRASSTLRDYQREALAALQHDLCSPSTDPRLLSMATGAGKTVVANELAVWWLGSRGGPILWATKDWSLLEQAANDVAQRCGLPFDQLSRIGGKLECLHAGTDGAIVYTTLQTLERRLTGGQLEHFRPRLVIWDECHWGEEATIGRLLLRWAQRRGIPVLGLTATPKPPARSAFRRVYAKDFVSLVREGYLARPELHEPIRTGVAWNPECLRAGFDFDTTSLQELAQHSARNDIIVRHYVQHRREYGKTITFACNRKHAITLAKLFAAYGVAARPIFSGQDAHTNRQYLRQFRQNSLEMIINVAMLTHGIDIPDARTVLLCRPTMSDILFQQMVGRGARKTADKDHFHVVEFADNLQRFGDRLQKASGWFEGQNSPGGSRHLPRNEPQQDLTFDPKGAPAWIPDNESAQQEARGLWYRTGQTFGVEIELTRSDFHRDMPGNVWMATAERIRRALHDALPGHVAKACLPVYGLPTKSHAVWNVERDNSAGWEVTSRVLQGEPGFAEVVDACAAIHSLEQELGLRVTHDTGLHLHIAWLGRNLEHLKRALRLARLFEPALATLIAPSRIAAFDGTHYDLAEANEFCKPISTIFSEPTISAARSTAELHRKAANFESRYVSFNIRPLVENCDRVEVRLHSGTTDAAKILPWLSLWQQILWIATQDHIPIPIVPDSAVIHPSGDIVALAKSLPLPGADDAFLRRLDQRRNEVASLWQHTAELQGWTRYPVAWHPAPLAVPVVVSGANP